MTFVPQESDKGQCDEAEKAFESLLASEANCIGTKESPEAKEDKLMMEIKRYKYLKIDRLNSMKSSLMFWEKEKFNFPILYKIASLILAIPRTQVSVERSFGALHFILSVLRERSSPKNIDNSFLFALISNT